MPCSLKTCRSVTTVEGVFCMVTGTQLDGPAEQCWDYRHCTMAVHVKVHPSQRAGRRRRSVTKYYRKETGLRSFQIACHELYGQSPCRKQAAAITRAATLKAIGKLLHRPTTLASVMRAYRAAKRRPFIPPGANAAAVESCAKAVWQLHQKLQPDRQSYAAIKGHAKIFAATVVSKAGVETDLIDARLNTRTSSTFLNVSKIAPIPEVFYTHFGVPCRAMSKMWREIKSKVHDAGDG